MSPIEYQDLLWDFTYSSTTYGGNVGLRVFQSEDQMYGPSGQSTPALPISLPSDWYSGTKRSRVDESTPLSAPSSFDLLDRGRRLWNEIPGPAKAPLLAATAEKPCRLKISSNSTAVDDLPWEWLTDESNVPFALRPQTRVVRSIPIRLPIPPLTVTPPLKVLLVLTNPRDESLLNPDIEIQAVSERLNSDPYQLKVLEEPTFAALTEALRDQPHILHYIGHSGIDRGEGCIILHTSENHTQWISGAKLAKILPPSLRLLCLSTCFTAPNYQILGLTRMAHVSAQSELPTTVTNLYPVAEQSVRAFWRNFYDALVKHQGSANEAFHDAQSAMIGQLVDLSALVPDWGGFSLVLRDGSGEVMRLQEVGSEGADTYAKELQAQYASRLANDLAQREATFGPSTSDSVRTGIEEERSKAANLTKGLYGEEPK